MEIVSIEPLYSTIYSPDRGFIDVAPLNSAAHSAKSTETAAIILARSGKEESLQYSSVV